MIFPLEVFRDTYITRIEIEPDTVEPHQAGLNIDALRQTRMIPYQERVFITNFDGKNGPIFFQQMYQIVPLECDIATSGEVVINEPIFEDGSLVVINDVLRGML